MIGNKLKCRNCGAVVQSRWAGDWVSCYCYKNHPDGKGCFIDSDGDLCERWGGDPDNFTVQGSEDTDQWYTPEEFRSQ